MKKIISLILIAALCMGLFANAALADDESGEQRVVIGANLDEEQRSKIYKDFGLNIGDVKEIEVTNAEEREYLEGLVPDKKIGTVALSCVFLTVLEEGNGLDITTNNINWCSKEMYINALLTAGITDAKVVISAPFPVSGTAALTGIYKAYEDITGEKLQPEAKTAGTEELVVTGELADMLGNADATELVGRLKEVLNQTINMNDDEVRAEIKAIAKEMNIEVSDGQVESLLSLIRSLEKLDVKDLEKKINDFKNTVNALNKTEKFFSNVFESVKGFFKSVGDFFSNLFGGGK